MKYTFVFFFCVQFYFSNAQISNAQASKGKAAIQLQVSFAETNEPDWDVNITNIKRQPEPASDYGNNKAIVNSLRKEKLNGNANSTSRGSRDVEPLPPVLLNNFTANLSQGTPNDNHIAVSNDDKIVSVVNTNVRVYNDTGLQLYQRSLSAFAATLGTFASVSDPRVLYDPVADRFILLFFAGSTSTTSKIIVAFSKTADPLGLWNFYSLPGNYLNDTTWSDYPIVTLSNSDLFMTFNHLRDNQGWQTGFRYSAIWQIDKAKGYAGDSLEFTFWHDVRFDGKPIWSVCPVQGSFQSSGTESYFLSVRPGDLDNDTVFLHTITNSHVSGNAQFSTKVLKNPVRYGLPPNAPQKDGQFLATNDARVLCAIIENNKIQYVQNTVDFPTVRSSVYVGEIDNPNTANPTLSAQLIKSSVYEYAYPSIASISNNQFDNRSFITCSYTSLDTFPGTVVFYKDAQGNISEPLVVKQGERGVNVLLDTVERWGDYTGIQRKYNEPNTAWLSGSYVAFSAAYRTWIAKVVNTDSAEVSSFRKVNDAASAKVYPNPVNDRMNVMIELPSDNFMRFDLFDVNGNLVRTLLEDHCKPGTNNFSFNKIPLASGIYMLSIFNHGKLFETKKLIVAH
jgi:hypothetical protein